MKLLKTLTVIAVGALALTAAFAEAPANKPDGKPPGKGGGPRGLDHLLPVKAVKELKLTAEQQAKYTELEAAFKKDAAAWAEKNPPPTQEEMNKAKEGDKATREALKARREPLMQKRKSYVDQFRATLTAEQKTELDKELEASRNNMRNRGEHGEHGDHPPKPPAE